VVMGNCGVGFAPVSPGKQDWLISLMEGVEDIPGTALSEGVSFEWESFPQYMDKISKKPHAIDIVAQVPHGALRTYVMGERGADHSEKPTRDEIETMGRFARLAIAEGAVGFSSSRTKNHRTRDGEFTPSLTAGADELLGIAEAIGEGGRGVFQMVSDFADLEKEFALLRKMVEVSGRPMSISVAQNDRVPTQWRRLLDLIDDAVKDGLPMMGQVPPRAVGLLLGLQASLHPFVACPSYKEVAALSLMMRVELLRNPELKAKILAESVPEGLAEVVARFDRTFVLGNPPNYEPTPEESIAARAKEMGIPANELAYDLLLEDGGHALLYHTFLNYTDFNLDVSREMLLDPNTVPGLGDAGAHCGMICDGSFPTFLMTHFGRDRTRGEKLELEWLVKRQTADTAAMIGLSDRGTIKTGMRADLNLIDWSALQLQPPEFLFDLPANGKRLVQRVDGYRMTLVAGEPVCENGQPTGTFPGKVVRHAASERGDFIPTSRTAKRTNLGGSASSLPGASNALEMRKAIKTSISAVRETEYETITVNPLSPIIGAEIGGVRMGADCSDRQVKEIRQALLDWKVVFFRGQNVNVEEHVAFGRRFGDLEIHPFTKNRDDYPEVVVIHHGEDSTYGQNNWHSDVTWRERPSLGSILRGITIPPLGGDTLFADMAVAYDSLPDDVKERIDGATAEHSFLRAFGHGKDKAEQARMLDQYPPARHPIVRTHPETNKKSLFVNSAFVTHIVDMEKEESDELLYYLYKHASVPEFQCRFRWRENSVAFWD
ncbi:MAG: TauD/TfdA family dioxygenase, partial [Deltaproteobacteria bacterium]|nr:TauD/TfdA family dioxygenase [Deltaproteobacteria bacterium]